MNRLLIIASCLFLFLTPAMADAVKREQVQFEPDSNRAAIDGSIKGYDTAEYVFTADAGDEITITFQADNRFAYFNLMPPGGGEALWVGSGEAEPNRYKGKLKAGGDYVAQVYLMRNAARRDEKAGYTISFALGGGSADLSKGGDFADGLMGGPDYWRVAGLSANDTLNVRSGAGTGNSVIGKLANGDTVRNLGCKMVGSSKWCQIKAEGDQDFSGWTNGKFLQEGGLPSDEGSANSEATGEVPCATGVGQPTGSCAFRVTRGSNGDASVWITLPSGKERYVEFVAGKPMNTDPGLELSFERTGDLLLLSIGGMERYEIPDALVSGG